MSLPERLAPRRQFDALTPRPVLVDQECMLEKHYSPQDIAELWGVSVDLVRDLFRGEPGVVDLRGGDSARGRARRSYSTIRIPKHVVQRVYARRQIG